MEKSINKRTAKVGTEALETKPWFSAEALTAVRTERPPSALAVKNGIWMESESGGITIRILHYRGVTWLLKVKEQL